jgi:hypothetical protein
VGAYWKVYGQLRCQSASMPPANAYSNFGDSGAFAVAGQFTVSANFAACPGDGVIQAEFRNAATGYDSTQTYTAKSDGTNYSAPAPGGPGPDRTLVTERDCVTAGGGVSTVTGTGPAYKEALGVAAVARRPACPSGTSVKAERVKAVTVGGSAPTKAIATFTAQALPQGVEPAPLVLYITMPDGTLQSCEQTPSPCASWYESQTKDDTYTCKQGVTVLALSECEGLRYRYNPKTVPTSQGVGCFDGMGLSPLTWPKGLILSPLKCLFIPDPVKMAADSANVRTAWGNTGPGKVLGGLGQVAGTVTNLGKNPPATCDGPLVEFDLPGYASKHVALHPLSSCNEVSQYVLGVLMPLSTAFVYVGAFWTGGRIILKTFGADVGEAPAEAAA